MIEDVGVFRGFVLTDRGEFMIQRPAQNQWGFELVNQEGSWPGGIDAASQWTAVSRDSVPPEIEAYLGWILDEEE
jgi:hypothetical protein